MVIGGLVVGHRGSSEPRKQSGAEVVDATGTEMGLSDVVSAIGARVEVWTTKATVVVGRVVMGAGGLVTSLMVDSSPMHWRCRQDPKSSKSTIGGTWILPRSDSCRTFTNVHAAGEVDLPFGRKSEGCDV